MDNPLLYIFLFLAFLIPALSIGCTAVEFLLEKQAQEWAKRYNDLAHKTKK